jgi:hypothetical protein
VFWSWPSPGRGPTHGGGLWILIYGHTRTPTPLCSTESLHSQAQPLRASASVGALHFCSACSAARSSSDSPTFLSSADNQMLQVMQPLRRVPRLSISMSGCSHSRPLHRPSRAERAANITAPIGATNQNLWSTSRWSCRQEARPHYLGRLSASRGLILAALLRTLGRHQASIQPAIRSCVPGGGTVEVIGELAMAVQVYYRAPRPPMAQTSVRGAPPSAARQNAGNGHEHCRGFFFVASS